MKLKRYKGRIIAVLAGVLSMGAWHASAADYKWIGPIDGYGKTTAYWNTNNNWTNITAGTKTYPNSAGSHVEVDVSTTILTDSAFAIVLPSTFTSARIGSCTVRCYTSSYFSETAYINLAVPPTYQQPLRILYLDNSTQPVVLQSHMGSMHFGVAYPDNNGGSRLDVRLISEQLIITNGNTSTRASFVNLGGGQTLQRATTLSGGTVQAPRRVTIQAGHQNADLTCRVSGTNTSFIGTWTVIGPRTTLGFARDTALGVNALNSVTLKNGAKLSLNTHATYADPSWTLANRTVQGVGSVSLGTAKPLTVATNGCLIPGETNAVGALALTASNIVMSAGSRLKVDLAGDTSHDSLTVTLHAAGSLTLGGALDVTTLGGYEPASRQTWPIITTTGVISGEFDSVSNDYDVYVDGTSVMLRRLPPMGTTVIIM